MFGSASFMPGTPDLSNICKSKVLKRLIGNFLLDGAWAQGFIARPIRRISSFPRIYGRFFGTEQFISLTTAFMRTGEWRGMGISHSLL